MSDPFTTMLGLQKQLLDAQRSTMGALHKGLNVGDGLVTLQEAGRRAAEANLAAWTSWARLWGVR